MNKGNIPVLHVQGRLLPEVWEESVLLTWGKGIEIKTEYDRPEDPPSKDCTMVMVVEEPFAEPRIHRGFPTGLEELEIYRQEVVAGIHDHRVGLYGWSYSYHDRLFNYPEAIDQIGFLIEKLSEVPYSRRSQAITWIPTLDPQTNEPPCLQRIWCRFFPDEEGILVFNMNTHWRSRDALKAAFMNMFAFTDLQRQIAEEIAKRRDEPVRVGRYVDISDSYHIYGKDWAESKGFLSLTRSRTFEQRTWTTDFAEPYFEEARRKLADEGN